MGAAPEVLRGIAVGAPLAGGVVQANAARAQGAATSAAAEYNAQLALLEGQTEANRRREAGRHALASERVRMAAGGIQLEGTPADVLAQHAFQIERDAVNAEIAGRNTARLDRAQGQAARAQAQSAVGTSLLTGAIGSLATFGRPFYEGR